MPSINMIAPRRAEKKRLEMNVRRLLLVIVAELILIVGIAGFRVTQIYSKKSMINDMEVQITKLQPTVRKIEFYKEAIEKLGPKVDTLGAAKTDTMRWCRILDDLSLSLPPKTWLTRFSTATAQAGQGGEPGQKISLNGMSINQNLVGEAMLRIHDNVHDFSEVDLHYTQKALVGFQSAVQFEVEASVKLPKTEKDKEVQKS